jgi:hypothetical protein
MDLNFKQISYDGELADFSEEDLRELVGEYEEAQESNVAEFEQAAEALGEYDEETIEDFEEAREALIEDIVAADTFDEVPVGSDTLETADFSELQEWQDFVAETPDETDAVEDEDGSTVDDFGTKGAVKETGDETDFADEALESMPGLEL